MAYEEQQTRTQEVTRSGTVADDQLVDQRGNGNGDGAVLGEKIVYLIYGILAGLLAIRFILFILGANRSNTFADFIYSMTSPLVAPFRGLFNIDTTYGVTRFDIESLIAILVYGLIAWALIKVIDLSLKDKATI